MVIFLANNVQNEPFLGILMLDTRFPRPLGDAGNKDSYAIPARIEIVEGAGSLDIVKNGRPLPSLVEAFKQKARKLEKDGALAITSTCGFLATIQREMEEAVSIPVMLSALCMHREIQAAHNSGPIAILTASARSLGTEVLQAVNIDPASVIICGMEDCPAFADAILRPKEDQSLLMDQGAIEADIVKKTEELLAQHPDISAFLLECGNLPPYQQAIAAATGKPVYSILDGVKAMVSGSALITR
nr:aspartate/glutamate racemase family protein [uncultured Cohaesibacter sp.]